MSTEDRLLVERIKKGDGDAFEVLYEELFHALLSVACKYVEVEAARDIVQDIFLKLWSKPQKFTEVTDLRFYLYRSVRNQCLNYMRDKEAESNYRNKVEDGAEDYFYNALLEEETFIRLRKTIDGFPEKYKNVINLNLDGLSDKEIAERLRISVDAVKQQKKRGKELLRKKLTFPFLLFLIKFL